MSSSLVRTLPRLSPSISSISSSLVLRRNFGGSSHGHENDEDDIKYGVHVAKPEKWQHYGSKAIGNLIFI